MSSRIQRSPVALLFAICVAIWGSTWLAITFQFGHVALEMSVGYRFLLASFILFAYCYLRKISLHFNRRAHADFALLGAALFCVSYILVYYSETYIISGMVAVGYSLSPLFNLVLARWFFGTPMTARVIWGAVLGAVGIICVYWPEFGKISQSRNAELGAILTMLSVTASALGSMAAMRNQKLGYPLWSSMAWGMFYGGAQSVLIGLLMGKSLAFDPSLGYLASLVYLSVLGSIVTFACYITLIGRIGPGPAGYIGVMTPIIALTLSLFFENFSWGWLTTVGVALSAAGNVVILRKKAG